MHFRSRKHMFSTKPNFKELWNPSSSQYDVYRVIPGENAAEAWR
jgi:hypothetical protein